MPEIARCPTTIRTPIPSASWTPTTRDNFDITDETCARARRAYFANISYLDDKVGELCRRWRTPGKRRSILFVSDHGDMLGERGLWFKMSFYEGSSRVPMMICAPEMEPGLTPRPSATSTSADAL